MPRLHYYVHGRGRGHATRSRAVIERLRQAGHEVVAFAGRDAYALLREHAQTRAVDSLMPGEGARASWRLLERVRQGHAALRDDRAALVISDGDLPGLLAARAGRRPSIAVGHGLVFYCCACPRGLPRGSWRREALKAGVSSLTAHRQIAVNFVPLAVRRGVLARPSVELLPATERTPDGPVVCYFRDGAPRSLLLLLADLQAPVIVFGATRPDVPGLGHEAPSRPRFVEALRSARAVIATAGSQLISECVALATPLLAVHDPHDDEQRLNAARLRHAGLGDGCPMPSLDRERLRAFLARRATRSSTWDAPDVATAVERSVRELLEGPR